MREIKLPSFGIIVTVEDGAGSIVSDLHESCTHCGSEHCNYDCDGSQGADEEHERDENRALYNAAIDGLESLILSCAVAGVDIESPAFLEAIETTVSAIAKNFED